MSVTPLLTQNSFLSALERLVAGAENELLLATHGIDPHTPLIAPETREMGLDTWADLIGWTCHRGVSVRLLVADFDPLFQRAKHRQAWIAASAFADVVQRDAQILCAPHPHRAGTGWQMLWRGRVHGAIKALRSYDSVELTPVERDILNQGHRIRPVDLGHRFCIADATECVIGGAIAPRQPQDMARTVHVADADFAASLRGHFTESWDTALQGGARSLANPAQPMPKSARAQGRADLRVVRTVPDPHGPFLRPWPRPKVTDYETALLKALEEAQEFVFIETPSLTHEPVSHTLAHAGKRASGLNVVIVLPKQAEFDQSAMDTLRAAFGDRLAILQGDGVCGDAVLVVVDARVALVGSGGLTPLSQWRQTEAAALIRMPDVVQGLFHKVAQQWLQAGADTPRQAQTWRDSGSDRLADFAVSPKSGGSKPF